MLKEIEFKEDNNQIMDRTRIFLIGIMIVLKNIMFLFQNRAAAS